MPGLGCLLQSQQRLGRVLARWPLVRLLWGRSRLRWRPTWLLLQAAWLLSSGSVALPTLLRASSSRFLSPGLGPYVLRLARPGRLLPVMGRHLAKLLWPNGDIARHVGQPEGRLCGIWNIFERLNLGGFGPFCGSILRLWSPPCQHLLPISGCFLVWVSLFHFLWQCMPA